ncbi:unnamed protein product [Closterium sp. NIES-54]
MTGQAVDSEKEEWTRRRRETKNLLKEWNVVQPRLEKLQRQHQDPQLQGRQLQLTRIAERRIGFVMEVARTSMIHAAAPYFLWPFAVRYVAHQLNLWPRVSLPETSPTLRWTGKVGDASVFRSVPFYSIFSYRSAPPPPPPLFLAPGPPPVDPLPPQGPAPSAVSEVDPLHGSAPVQVAVGSGAAPGAASKGAAFGGAEVGGAGSEGAGSGGTELGGAEPEGVELGGAELEGAECGGAAPRGAALSGGTRDTRAGGAAFSTGARGTGGTAATGLGGSRTSGAGAGDPTEPGAAGTGGAGAGVAGVGGPNAGGTGAAGAGVGGTGAGGAGAAGAGAVDPGAGGARGTVRPRPYFVPLLKQVQGVPSSTGLPPPFLYPPRDQSQPPLQPASPLPAPSPYTEQSGGLRERRDPASCPILPICTARRAPRLRPHPVPGTHAMALRPSSIPVLHVSCLVATAVTVPSFESAAASALVAELLDFAATCRLDYATALVAESVSISLPSVGGECALGTDVLEDRQEDFECLPAPVPDFASCCFPMRETQMHQTS